MVLRAADGKALQALIDDIGTQGARQRRFANAGLAAHHDDLAALLVAALLPCPPQQADLLVPPDQQRRVRRPFRRCFGNAGHAPGAHRLRQPFQLVRAEIAVDELIPRQLARDAR